MTTHMPTTCAPSILVPILPRLARRCEVTSSSSRAWLTPGFGASTAYISLAPGLVCVFDSDSVQGLTHQFIGAMGLTVHQAWNSAARTLSTDLLEGRVTLDYELAEDSLGSVVPKGVRVRSSAGYAASWLAHPQLFSTLYSHVDRVLLPHHELLFYSRDQQELYVFDAPLDDVLRLAKPEHVMRYSVGFPLSCDSRVRS